MFLLIQNKITERMVTVKTGTTELDFGVEVISRQSPSLFLLYYLAQGSTDRRVAPCGGPWIPDLAPKPKKFQKFHDRAKFLKV